jgi:hypothetical protein
MIYLGSCWNLRLTSYYRVLIIYWRILVSFRGFSVQIIFFGWPVKHLRFHTSSSFAFKILFNVNGKVTHSVTHHLFFFSDHFILLGFLGFGETDLDSHGCCWCCCCCSNNYDYNLDPIGRSSSGSPFDCALTDWSMQVAGAVIGAASLLLLV